MFGLQDTLVHPPLPEVKVVAYRNPPEQSFYSWIWSLSNRIDWFLLGNTYELKVRNATNYENWMIRNVDQQILEEIAKVNSAHLTDPALHNYVRSNESYQGKTEDKEIIEEKAGNNIKLIEDKTAIWVKDEEIKEYVIVKPEYCVNGVFGHSDSLNHLVWSKVGDTIREYIVQSGHYELVSSKGDTTRANKKK